MALNKLDVLDALRPLAALLAPLVAEQLAKTTVTYSTERPELYPPDAENRRQARDRIRRVPGHIQIGSGRATQWSIDAEAYRQHHTRRPFVLLQALVANDDDEAIAESAIAAAPNLRMTRGAR
jgi:hypothetical protein